ncbi:cytochrome P450 [Streptomyces sulphureus]|uniref:cytochrome P450 n=1 Tax=Streptomyces sulphureus TaxID=47758 RepID=UPI0003671C5E|nr:cytochrome P450 [Streptomyces sulphureus]
MSESLSETPGLPLSRSCPFDPPDGYKRLREEEPVSRVRFADGNEGWLLTKFDDVRTFLLDTRFSSNRNRAARTRHTHEKPKLPAGAMVSMDPPEHTRYRRLLAGQFTVRRVRQLEPRIVEYVNGQLDEMEAAGPGVDLVETFALPVPSLVICDLLGVPTRDRHDFQKWAQTVLNVDLPLDEVHRAKEKLFDFITALVHEKAEHPQDDIISGLLHAPPEEQLTREEIIGISVLLLIAGHESTSNMLSIGAYALLRHPRELAKLKADPSLIDNAVEELLRYLSIVHLEFIRTATEEIEFAGHLIKPGETVKGSMVSANRDPDRYPEPDVLDLNRKDVHHLTFGHGIHQCIAQQLARVELRVSFSLLFSRFPTLRPAIAPEDVRFKDDSVAYGVKELPVAWDVRKP